MSSPVPIKIVGSDDTSLFEMAGAAKLVEQSDDKTEAATTSKVLEVSSGRRRMYEAKNDPASQKRSEKRVPSRVPTLENGELKSTITILDSEEIRDDDLPVRMREPYMDGRADSALSPREVPGLGKVIELNVSPVLPRRDAINYKPDNPNGHQSPRQNDTSDQTIAKMVSDDAPIGSGSYLVKSEGRKRLEQLAAVVAPVDKETPKLKTKEPRHKSKPKSREVREPEVKASSGNVHYSTKSVIAPVDMSEQLEDYDSAQNSSRRRVISTKRDAAKKQSKVLEDRVMQRKLAGRDIEKDKKVRDERVVVSEPRKAKKKDTKPVIIVGGKQIPSGELENSSDRDSGMSDRSATTSRRRYSESEPNSNRSDSNTDTTSRRKIDARSRDLQDRIRKKFPKGDFDPDDESHMRFAIKAAVDSSKALSIQEAIDNGEHISASVLKSLTRPNAVEEVIEQLVSQRREILYQKRQDKKRNAAHKKREPSGHRSKKTLTENAEVAQKLKELELRERELALKEKELLAKTESKKRVKRVVRKKASAKVIGEDEAEESDGPIIETVDDPDDKDAPARVSNNKIGQDVKLPEVKGQSILVGGNVRPSIPEENEVEQIGGMEEVEPNGQEIVIGKKSSKKRAVGEENVKIPKGHRQPKSKERTTKPDALGQTESIYDPLGVGEGFDEESSETDSDYEESSDDDEKLTIKEKKDEMIYRFRLIKEQYPMVALPRVTKKTKLSRMVKYYEHAMSRIKLKVKVTNYKVFLAIGFLAMQFGAKKLTGLDSAGFTANQMQSIHMYDKYLRELGEVDFGGIGSDWPVTVRLGIFMFVNLGIFLLAKFVFKKTGKDMTSEFHKLYAQLTGGDDYIYIKEKGEAAAGLDVGGTDEGGGGGGGLFGMLKSVMGLFGGGGGGDAETRPKRGESKGPSYLRRKKQE